MCVCVSIIYVAVTDYVENQITNPGIYLCRWNLPYFPTVRMLKSPFLLTLRIPTQCVKHKFTTNSMIYPTFLSL